MYMNSLGVGEEREKSIPTWSPASQCQWGAVTEVLPAQAVWHPPWGDAWPGWCTHHSPHPETLQGLLWFLEGGFQAMDYLLLLVLTEVKHTEVSGPIQWWHRPMWKEVAPLLALLSIRLSENSLDNCLTWHHGCAVVDRQIERELDLLGICGLEFQRWVSVHGPTSWLFPL